MPSFFSLFCLFVGFFGNLVRSQVFVAGQPCLNFAGQLVYPGQAGYPVGFGTPNGGFAPNGGIGGNLCPNGAMCQCFAGQQIGTCPGNGVQCSCSLFGGAPGVQPGLQPGFQPGLNTPGFQGQGYPYCPRNSALSSSLSIPLVLGALMQII
jgi:hypothetical protein